MLISNFFYVPTPICNTVTNTKMDVVLTPLVSRLKHTQKMYHRNITYYKYVNSF